MGRGGWASPTCRKVIKSQESYRPDKTQSLCDPWSRGWALFPTGLSTRLQYSTASQTATESYEDTINHVPDKKSGRGGWDRRGALAGFYGSSSSSAIPYLSPTVPSKTASAFFFFFFFFFTKKHSPTNNQGKRTTEMTLDNKTKGSRGDVPMWLARIIRPEVSES